MKLDEFSRRKRGNEPEKEKDLEKCKTLGFSGGVWGLSFLSMEVRETQRQRRERERERERGFGNVLR